MERKSFALVFLYALLTVRCAYAAVCSDKDGTPTPSICNNVGPYCVLDTDTRLCVRNCSQIDASSCASYPGCTLVGEICTQCPAGSYCPGGNMVESCPEPFSKLVRWTYSGNNSITPRLDITGNDSINSCYAETTCGTDKVYIGCPNHWDTNDPDNPKCPPPTSSGDKPNVQWAYNYTHQQGFDPNAPILPKEFSDWTDNNQLDLNNFYSLLGDNPSYHIEVKAKYKNQLDSDNHGHYIWKEDSVAEIKCLADTLPCSTFTPNTDHCANHTTASDCDNDSDHNCKWVSPNGDINKCVSRDDVGATSANIHCPPENISSDRYAHWIDKDNPNNLLGFGYWDVSECRCDYSNIQPNQTTHCYGTGTYPSMVDNSTSPNINTVHSTYEHIIFNNTDPETFVCRKCESGPYYANYLPGIHIVDKCISIPDNQNHGYGWWRKPAANGYCDGGIDGTLWPESLNTNPCELQKCPTGKTTTEYGPIGSSGCKYGNETQLCDSQGCKSLSVFGDPQNWTDL